MIYLDTSALTKLVIKEDQSGVLRSWLQENAAARKSSSALCRTELPRAVRSGGDPAYLRSQVVLGDLWQLPITFALLDKAGSQPGSLRSLDAIHLVSALELRDDLETFVAYDQRLLDAAGEAGLRTASPGAS